MPALPSRANLKFCTRRFMFFLCVIYFYLAYCSSVYTIKEGQTTLDSNKVANPDCIPVALLTKLLLRSFHSYYLTFQYVFWGVLFTRLFRESHLWSMWSKMLGRVPWQKPRFNYRIPGTRPTYSLVNFTREHVGQIIFLHFSNSLASMLAKSLVNMLAKSLVNMLVTSLVNMLTQSLGPLYS